MNKNDQNRVLGAVLSMTYSLYPLEMTEARNALVRRALALLDTDASAEELEALLFDLRQSKHELDPGCQCLHGNGYYPEDFTDGFRKLDREDEVGAAACALFAVLEKPRSAWDAAEMYRAIRAIYNAAYGVREIDEIRRELENADLPGISRNF